MEYAIETGKEFDGHNYHLIGSDGQVFYTDKTRKDFENEQFRILSEEEFNVVWETYLNGLCGTWTEISREEFDEMLNVLPPLRWRDGGFFMSERLTGDVTGFYQEIRGRFYHSRQRLSTPREAIINSLIEFINTQTSAV